MTVPDDIEATGSRAVEGFLTLLAPTLSGLSSTELVAALRGPSESILEGRAAPRSAGDRRKNRTDQSQTRAPVANPGPELAELLEAARSDLSQGDERAVSRQIVTSAEEIAETIRAERIRQARASFNAALALAVLGVLLVFLGVALVVTDVITAGVVTSLASAITETVALLLFRLNRQANDRLDRVNRDLARLSRFRLTMDLIDSISDSRSRDRAIAQALRSLNSK